MRRAVLRLTCAERADLPPRGLRCRAITPPDGPDHNDPVVESEAGDSDDALPHELAFEVTLTAEAPAAFVWLETEMPGRWSDNGFIMTERERVLTFYADTSRGHSITASSLRKSLNSGRWTNPKTGVSTLALKPAGWSAGEYQGALFSLVDTSKEYTGAGVGPAREVPAKP